MSVRNEIEDFSVARLREVIETYMSEGSDRPYVAPDLSVVLHGRPNFVFQGVLRRDVPYRIEQTRLGLLRRGTADISLNLQDYHVTAGTALFASDGCVLQIHQASPDTELEGFSISDALLVALPAASRPDLLRTPQSGCYFPVGSDDASLIDAQFALLHQLATRGEALRPAALGIVASLFALYDLLHARHLASTSPQGRQRREREVFDRFLLLVSQHCTRQRELPFYADRLCLTPRYLGTLVRTVSGRTAKEWIDRAVLTEARLQLRHTTRSVLQISEALGFPNPSFFSKYFKRLTGQTPLAYREG